MFYRNLLLTDNGYNGMTIIIKKLGESHLIENFDISHGSDVGISCYGGQGVTIRNGVIHDMDGTYHSIQTHTALATEGSPDGDGVPGTGPGVYVYNVTSYNNYAGYYVLAGLPNVVSTLDHVNFTGGYGIRCASYSEQPVRMVNSYVKSDPHPDAAAFFIRNNNYFEVFNTTIDGAIWSEANTIGSKFYHNSFVNPWFDFSGTVQITWDDGSRGNYWSDYTGQDSNSDGIGDTPYVINSQNRDNRPLMVPP
jgi:nitrous oxidase accessory protein NosD